MKKLYPVILLFIFASAASANDFGGTVAYPKPPEVNKSLTEQSGAAAHKMNVMSPEIIRNECEIKRLHLMFVERMLRNKNVSHINIAQKTARINNLNNLHRYWVSGQFPVNRPAVFGDPISINDHIPDAVEYLIKVSGNEELYKMIQKRSTFTYVYQDYFMALNAWVKTSGLTLEELAWIQPSLITHKNTSGIA